MSRVRFATAEDVFEAFPAAREDIGTPPTKDEPLAFAKKLSVGPTPEDALAFCAYMLPRREAVWWAAQCVRNLQAFIPEDEPCLKIAEAWVREPEEHRRRAALRMGSGGDRHAPATWVARAAGWSSGSMLVDDTVFVPCPPHLTAKAAGGAVLAALARVGAKARREKLTACLEAGLSLARGEPQPAA